jgi:prepilin-type N-terminal cleavage/methylation domain-containing protein
LRPSVSAGFTLIEVVLAIAVGLIIIAGISIGYVYAKRATIINNQRKDAAAIKTMVEQAIAAQQANLISSAWPWMIAGVFGLPQWEWMRPGTSPLRPADPSWVEKGVLAGIAAPQCTGMVPPCITQEGLGRLANQLPSLRVDPYTGVAREICAGNINSCYWAPSQDGSLTNGSLDGDTGTSVLRDADGGNIPDAGSENLGSRVAYINFTAFSDTVTLALADGSTRQFYGYVIIETDDQDNIVVAEGGDSTLAGPAPVEAT